MPRERAWALGTAVAMTTAMAWVAPATSQVLPAQFALEPVVTGPFAGYPVGFAFLPDGRILVVEKDTGHIRLAPAGGGAAAVIGQIAGLRADGERGLLGVAVDPSWPVRPWIYCMANYADGRARITMHPASGDLEQSASTAVTLGNPYVLVDHILDVFPNHKGGTLRFGPDGMLYAATGDDSDVCAAQNRSAYNGKILRLTVAAMPGPGTGPPPLADLVPADNPFTGPTDAARLVFALGMRNPFRFTIDAATGDLVIGDVGAHAQEEIDLVRFGQDAGANLGWPFYEGTLFIPAGCPDGGPTFLPPIHTYAHGDPVPLAVIAGPFYRSIATSSVTFPSAYDESIFFHDHYSGWIRRLVRSQGNWFLAPPVPGQADPTNWATEMGFITDLQVGPDGALYLLVILGTVDVEQGLHRIVYTAPVDAPVPAAATRAWATPNPARVARGTTIRFDPARAQRIVHIYDVAGRAVRALRAPPGAAAVRWDGLDAAGRPAGPGVYVFEPRGARQPAARGRVLLVH